MDVRSMSEGYRDEILKRLEELVSINSEQSAATSDAPFGEGPKKALEAALKMLEKDGLKTVNLDNYIGYGEMGEGDQLIAIVGHLDVVPARKEDGWNTDPYTMVEKDGILYGRGVSDDKGGVVASMIALKIIQDMQIPVKKRIRLIMGCNEETGSKCLKYYVDHDEQPDYGFTPDGDFPCINGEKGMMAAHYVSKKTGIRDIDGGTAGNIVCSNCYVVVDKCSFSKKKLEDIFNNNNINYEIEEDDNTVKITVQGVAAHASMPTLGVNAIAHLLTGLKEAGYQDPFVDFFCSRIGLNTNGEGLGLNLKDEYSELTLNCGYIHMNDGVISGNIDVRFPVTMTGKQITKACSKYLEDDGGEIIIDGTFDPLYYSPDSPLVESLTEAYHEVTGDVDAQPLVIGGGTYAKGINNTIAFGCAFQGKDYKIHNANEWCPVEDLIKQVEIYVAGILKLLEL
jgi:succinyl-diaminopimelate desuccinylase